MVNRDSITYRVEYGREKLKVDKMLDNPIQQFKQWFKDAEKDEVPEPNIMTLATLGNQDQPTIRVVLLKEITDQGLIFYTNFNSRKGREMATHSKVALNFFWHKMERQVRFDGEVSKVSNEISDAYFKKRPRGSQLGAWVSEQSSKIESREFLEQELQKRQEQYEGLEIPRPPHWGGYMVMPTQVEYWQGGLNRLHDRIQYTMVNGEWNRCRLAP